MTAQFEADYADVVISTFNFDETKMARRAAIIFGAIERAARETAIVPWRESLGTKALRVVAYPTAVVVKLFSEGGALYIAPRPSKKKPNKVKKAKNAARAR